MLPAGQSEALFFLSSFPFRSKGKLERRCEEPCIGAAVLVQMITGADNYINEVTGKNNLVMSLETFKNKWSLIQWKFFEDRDPLVESLFVFMKYAKILTNSTNIITARNWTCRTV